MTVTPEQLEAQSDGMASNSGQQSADRRSRVFSWLGYILASALYRTLRIQCENFANLLPKGQGAILVTWHGRTLIPANVFKNRGYWTLISLSRDGEIQNRIVRRYGFQTIRGSTGRGGVRGALQMARKVRAGGVLAFTPDGPRGPTHKVQLGVILMAEKSGAPIVPIGISVSRRWLIRSWDLYMVPQPFARAYLIAGAPIYIPPNLDDVRRRAYADEVEIAINCVEREAEARAGHTNYPAEWRTKITSHQMDDRMG